ncbi:gustatory receptor for sugar taste 64e [Daphnia magna]|uniref:Gustatory receptor n=1 Tax=Daphnia magna TaxID=35525 RepID=A0ABQ9ZFV2_9CRUS|nr:gustatory receptor for sugar taste 64e [Daphnia magna]KAK4011558.1 hypothetical protein OUZ56_020676 [Daphnia magna]
MARKSDVIQLWSPVISFFRCYAIVPLRQCHKEPYFERCRGSFYWCLLVAFVYLCTFIFSILLVIDTFNSSSKMIADATFYLIYYAHCEMTVVFFLLQSSDLLQLLQHWIDTERLLEENQIFLGRTVKCQCWFIFIATVIMSNLENALYIAGAVKDAENVTEIFYLLVKLAGKETDLNPYFGDYKDVYGFALIFVESLSEVAWISGDFIIALVSIILRRYYEVHREQLRSQPDVSFQQLERLRRVQLALSTLTHKVAELFSPLILITIGCDVIYILTFLYSGLDADISSPSLLVRFIFTYSFAYVILRLMFSVYLASRLTELPRKTVDYLYRLPSLVGYSMEQQRNRLIKMDLIVQEIQNEPTALSGGGFFVLSKSSASKLFGLIVTYEVVMLQLPR